MYKLPERGGGGGEVIWAMPERKHSFLKEVFPKVLHIAPHWEIPKSLVLHLRHIDNISAIYRDRIKEYTTD